MRSEEEIQAILEEAEKEWGSPWWSGYRYALKVVLDADKEYPLGIPGIKEIYKGNGEWVSKDKEIEGQSIEDKLKRIRAYQEKMAPIPTP